MIPWRPRTLTFRLALSYALLSALVSGVVFVLVYLTLATNLMQRMDDRLLKMARELRQIHATNGRAGATAELKILEDTEGTNRVFVRVLAADATVLAASDMEAWTGLDGLAGYPRDLVTDSARFKTIVIPTRHHPARFVYLKGADGTLYQVGYTLRDDDELLEDFRQVFTHAFVVLLVCGGIVGWFLSRRAMQGVERVREAAVSIGTGDFSRRVPPGHEGQEIVDLAVAFNEMIEKIQALIKELKDVTDNIAHDLRSPITRMRGAAETTLTGVQQLADYQDLAVMVVEECDRLVCLINTMLEIAETDAGLVALHAVPVDMHQVVREAYELFEAVALKKGLHLEIDCPETPLLVLGDRARLQRCVSNLIDNAVKFTPPDGRVRLKAAERQARIIITVSDTGPGLDPKDQARIFERFYRGDRSRSTPGNGLGLSLAHTVVKAHGGEITVQSLPGQGCTFVLSLPQAPPSDG